MFVDKAKIKVKGGDGGSGCCSFLREKFLPKGGPNGGDGGKGGDVILKSVLGEQSLVTLIYNRHFSGKRGVQGKGKGMHGKKGDDVYVNIPMGTVISDAYTDEVIIDMDTPDMEYIIAKGGHGGRGNTRFVTATNRIPMEKEVGFPGEELEIVLELKSIADIGLVGFPNAGKSTFLGAISNAHPKVAPYPFTTLHPVLGVVDYENFEKVRIADIPGLIEGAHDNVGLGHSFLKHIERTTMLAFVLDMGGVDGRNPWDDYEALQNELELYMKGLSKRKHIILANKMDLPESEENLELLKAAVDEEDVKIIPISANTDKDFTELKQLFTVMLEKKTEIL